MAAKKLGAQTATQEEQAKKAEFKPVQAATEPAAPKQADTKQKIKKQAAAAKEDAPVSKPVTSPHVRPAQFYERLTSIARRATNLRRSILRYWERASAHLSPTLPRWRAPPRASPRAASSWALLSSRWRSGRASV